jgi:isocitrate dehydrogenase (NAD+)
MPHEVTLVPGDDIGITNHILSIVEALGVDIRWDKPTESASHESLLASVRHNGCALMGWQRGARDRGELPPTVVLREDLNLFAQLRPIQGFSGMPSRHPDVDLLLVREVTEDVYAHLEHESIPGVFESLKVTTRQACARIARYAMEIASLQGRERVTIVHKANIMKLSDGMFLNTCLEVGKEYPHLTVDDVIVDALCMKLVINPNAFDVLLCGNLFGDIVGDLCSGLVGGPSNAPSINVGADGTVLITAGHGSPKNLSNSERSNPLPLLIPTIHLLRHLDEQEAADRLRAALEHALTSGVVPIAEGGDADANTFCDALTSHLARQG